MYYDSKLNKTSPDYKKDNGGMATYMHLRQSSKNLKDIGASGRNKLGSLGTEQLHPFYDADSHSKTMGIQNSYNLQKSITLPHKEAIVSDQRPNEAA